MCRDVYFILNIYSFLSILLEMMLEFHLDVIAQKYLFKSLTAEKRNVLHKITRLHSFFIYSINDWKNNYIPIKKLYGWKKIALFLWSVLEKILDLSAGTEDQGARRFGPTHCWFRPRKNNEEGISLNAVEHEPVPTRVLNPKASEASNKQKQRSYRILLKPFRPNENWVETDWAETVLGRNDQEPGGPLPRSLDTRHVTASLISNVFQKWHLSCVSSRVILRMRTLIIY